MRNHRSDVVATAIEVLDNYGLADLSMRRIAAELGVRPSALYHHVANKQELLAAVADEILTRSLRDIESPSWRDALRDEAYALRDAMLAYRDGAELIATVHAFGLGAETLRVRLDRHMAASGLSPDLTPVATSTILYFVFGHVGDEQTALQAESAGAATGQSRPNATAASFAQGLEMLLDGISSRAASASS